MGKKAPRAPDPWATAQAQGAMNKQTAITEAEMNMTNQYNPWGSVEYEQRGTSEEGNPLYSQTTSLTPEQQAIFNASQGAEGNLADLAQQQSGMLKDYMGERFQFDNQDAEQWAYDLASPRIMQQQGQSEASLRSMLANKGIREGSAAWNAEMQRMTNANSDQLNQLALTGRGQAFNEALATRNQPINEITALLSGSQVSNPAQMSGPTPQVGVGGVDYTGLVNQKYQGELANHQAKMGGLFGLAGAGLQAGMMMSDERLKTDIKRVGQTDAGTPIFTYRYKWGGPIHMGVMAQDVPDAAVMTDSGYLAVNYSEVL